VVFTGYHGDKVWDAQTSGKYLNDQIIRGDISGLNLSEIRLKSGFIHVAVPFMLARNISSLVKISRSAEMAPWRLNNTYDRPIPRRIAESVGIDRRLFGMRKKAVIGYYYYPVNPQLRKGFFEFLKKNYKMTGSHVYMYTRLNQLAYLAMRIFTFLKYFKRSKAFSLSPNISMTLGTKRNILWKNINLHYLMFIWSVEVLSERTAKILRKHVPTSLDAIDISESC
jgi:hypothetical protein